ncbi:MAG: hypothetical protein K6G81_08815 [Lachnospiraceae bacterium]|nr:hypothetical protein [Lachnospiraceae bacterium]
MGFSFILENAIDNGAYNGLNTGWNPVSKGNGHSFFRERIRDQETAFHQSLKNNSKSFLEKKKSHSEVIDELKEIEDSKQHFLLLEKDLLYLKNKNEFQSIIIKDIAEGLLEFYENSVEALSETEDLLVREYKVDSIPIAADTDEEASMITIISTKMEAMRMITEVVASPSTSIRQYM